MLLRLQFFTHVIVTFLFFLVAGTKLVPAAYAAPWTAENSKWNINFNPDGSDPSKYFGQWNGHTYFPSPEDWRAIPIYHLITDRFRDGDPRNNDGKYGGFDVTNIGMRQGGDFKGVTEKLDYIKGLGFKAILLSPFFQNGHNSYHGYGQLDFTLLDDRFGTLKELRTLVSEAHKRGIYVIADIVVNHMASLLYEDGYKHGNAPFRFHDGEYKLHYHDDAKQYADFQINNDFISTGKYPPVYNRNGDLVEDHGQGSFWKSDFHHNGSIVDYYDPWNSHLGNIYGFYDDLRTSHTRVQKKIIAMTKSLLASTDIDAIRMDTPMQVPPSFFEAWAPEVKSYARKLGKNNFFIFGEFFVEPRYFSTLIGRGTQPKDYGKGTYLRDKSLFDGGINYPIFELMNSLFLDKKAKIKTYLGKHFEAEKRCLDLYHAESRSQRYRMLNFFNNHDQRRVSTRKDGFTRSKLLTAFIAFWPGIPLFYYGDEQEFASVGSGLEGYAREPMMKSIAWKQHPHKRQNAINPVTYDNFDTHHPMYQYVRSVMQLRSEYDVFQKGQEVELLETVDDALFAFRRTLNETQEHGLIVFNFGQDVLRDISLPSPWESGSKIEEIFSREPPVSSMNKDGQVFIQEIAPYSVYVFLLQERVKQKNLVGHTPVDRKHFNEKEDGVFEDRLRINQSSGSTLKKTIKLHHLYPDAKYFRISSDNAKSWKRWESLDAPKTTHTLSCGWHDIVVQYWRDGSSAYFARDSIDVICENSYFYIEFYDESSAKQ